MPKNLSIPEACHAAGISRAMMYKLFKLKKGPPLIKIGRRSFVSSASLETWLKKMEVQNAQ